MIFNNQIIYFDEFGLILTTYIPEITNFGFTGRVLVFDYRDKLPEGELNNVFICS